MKKIVKMFKKYRRYILIGIVILLLISLIVVLVINRKKESKYPKNPKRIQSPYVISEEQIKINLESSSIEIPEYDKVFRVNSYDTSIYRNFLERVFGRNEIDFSKYSFFEYSRSEYVIFSVDTNILTLSSRNGLSSIEKVSSKNQIGVFLKEYFKISDSKIEEINTIDTGIEYKGRYKVKGVEIGSSSLNGYAFVINTNTKGEIVYLSILQLRDQDLLEYQYMPLENISNLVKIDRYPKTIFHNKIEDRFYSMLRTAKLTDLFVKDISLIYLFTDTENSYVFPTYKLNGEGKVIDGNGEKYWSDTSILICAVDPAYLTKREVEDVEIYEEEGAPVAYPEGVALY